MEIKKLIGPQGSVVPLPRSRQVLVTETAGRLRAIRSVLARSQTQLQRDAQQIEVIRLVKVDPQTAVLAITKLFGTAEGKTPAPKVDADPATHQLLVRGTELQISQIRSLLEKMGETAAAAGVSANREKVRVVPLSGPSGRAALERLEEIWPTLRPNRIRVVVPPKVVRSGTPAPAGQPGGEPGGRRRRGRLPALR